MWRRVCGCRRSRRSVSGAAAAAPPGASRTPWATFRRTIDKTSPRVSSVSGPATQAASPAPLAARRCHLSLVFCDLCDSTALSAAMEAEEYALLLAGLRGIYETVVARHGGTVVRVQGDGMLAVFGYPHPREGDGRRSVEAALELHRAVSEMPAAGPRRRGTPLRLHSGVHAGMVLVQQGDVVLGRLELLGAPPNIAGRLSDEAERDEILVSDETLGPDRSLFDAGAPRMVRVDRQGTLIACLPVRGRAASGTAFEARLQRGLQPFIGRRDEFRRLEDCLGRALAGAALQVAIAGPPGVGKTRLAEQFALHAQWKGCRVLRGYCDGELGATPLQPVLQLLRGAFGLTRGASPPQARGAVRAALEALGLAALAAPLVQVLGLHDGEAAAAPQDAALPAIGALFASQAAHQPLVLFVDDWHWADAVTRQALSTIAAAAAAQPLVVLCSTRAIEGGDATMHNMEVIDLQPFSEDEAAESIRKLLPQGDPFVAAEIRRYAGGNALFIEELCHSAAHDSSGRRLVRQHVGAAWLEELIESRVARLADEQAQLVRSAAVIGNVIPLWLFSELTGLQAEDPRLHQLAEKDLLFPDAAGTLRFKHGLTRDVIYESVGLRERRALHLRVAEALQRHADSAREAQPHEALAYHFGAGGRPAEAADNAEIAADRAAAISALDRAKALYHAALARLDESDDIAAWTERWLAIANKLGLICVFDASWQDLPVFERGVELARAKGDAALIARAEYWLGYVLYALGESYAAIAHCERARAAAGDGADPLAVQIRATLGQLQAAASQYGSAQALLEEAVAIKRSHRRGARPPVGLAYSLVCLGAVVGDRGDFERAQALFDEAAALVHGITHEIAASIEGWRAAVLSWQGRWADTHAAAQESERIAEQTRSLFQFCQARVTSAYAQWKLTGDPACVQVLDQANAWREPSHSGLFRSLNHGWLVDAWIDRGDVERARRHAARGLLRARRGDLIGTAMTLRALARHAAGTGDALRAARYLAQARKAGERRQSAHEAASTLLCSAEVALALGDRAGGRQHAEAAIAAFDALRMSWHAQRAQLLLAAS